MTGPACQLWDKLADGSVDLFLTDPPYSEIECYRELAELADVKLKRGGLCLAYCGQCQLPSVLEAMRALTYYWAFAIRFGGPHRPIYSKRIQNTWQPVVAFSRGKPTVIDGPFAETKELIAGFTIIQVKSLEEAVELVKRTPNVFPNGEAVVEIRKLMEVEDFGDEFTPNEEIAKVKY